MTSPDRRRPLPALVFLVILTGLAGLVWWRVLHRSDASSHKGTHQAASTSTATKSACPSVALSTPTDLPIPAHTTVLVLNSTDRTGIAGAARKILITDGFKVQPAANDGPTYGGHGLISGVAQIRYGPSTYPAAVLMSYYFPDSTLTESDSAANLVIVSLGAKYTRPAPKATVLRNLAAAGKHVDAALAPSTPPAPQPSSC